MWRGNVSAILYFQCSTSPLDATSSPSTRLWFTTCHRRGRQSNCFTLILRSRGSYRGLCPHATSPQKHCGFQRAYLCAARPFPPLPLHALAVDSVHLDRAHDTSVVGPISRPLSASFCSPLPLFETRRFPYARVLCASPIFRTHRLFQPGLERRDPRRISLFDARRPSVKFAFPLHIYARFLFFFFAALVDNDDISAIYVRALKCKFQRGNGCRAERWPGGRFDVRNSGGRRGVTRRLLHAN